MDDDFSVVDGSPAPQIHAQLKTPRSAAIAGVLFSILFSSSFWLLRLSIPVNCMRAVHGSKQARREYRLP